jgi:predicted phosphodiesterase
VRVAALYDIHGNLPALDAVLAEIDREDVDLVVVGGDVAFGPMPAETLDRLAGLDLPTRWVMGNGDRELVDAFDTGAVPEGAREIVERLTHWVAARLEQRHRDRLAAFEPAVTIDVDGLGPTLFCHGSPRSDSEILTAVTPEDRLRRVLGGVAEDVVVCGHTHRQFDHTAGGRRVVNAGAVGMPYEGDGAAFWALLGPGVELRRTAYDVDAAAAAIRATGAPEIDELMLRESLLEPADPDAVARFFEDSAR